MKTLTISLICTIFLISNIQASASDLESEVNTGMPTFRTFIVKQLFGNAKGQNVHDFNRLLYKHRDFLRKCNKLYGLDKQGSWPDMLNGLSTARKAYEFSDSFEHEIKNLRAYLKAGHNDEDETGVEAIEMLSAVWNYLESVPLHLRHIPLSETFFYLQQNTKEAGGCFPGYVGRLMLVNSLFVIRSHAKRNDQA